MSEKRKAKVIAYVDGFNLYFSLKEKGWQRYYWLNPSALCASLLHEDQELILTKYFTARIAGPEEKRRRQNAFCEALENAKGVRVIYGRYKYNPVRCTACQHTENVPTEKRSDVSLAVEMLLDAHNNQFDTALLVSGDTDFCPLLEAITRIYPTKRVVVCFPPERQNRELKDAASASLIIGRGRISQAQFPDTIEKPDGHILSRPERWTDAYQDRIEQEKLKRDRLKGGLE